MKPHFTHYCPNCVFTGQTDEEDQYWCPGPHFVRKNSYGPGPRIVVRAGNHASWSILVSLSANMDYVESLLSAIKAGYVNKVDADNALRGEKLPV